jgi:hypothetical protein
MRADGASMQTWTIRERWPSGHLTGSGACRSRLANTQNGNPPGDRIACHSSCRPARAAPSSTARDTDASGSGDSTSRCTLGAPSISWRWTYAAPSGGSKLRSSGCPGQDSPAGHPSPSLQNHDAAACELAGTSITVCNQAIRKL